MYEHVYLLHGKGGSTEGSVKLIENILASMFPCEDESPVFHRLPLRHSNPHVLAERSYVDLCMWSPAIEKGSLLVGISLGGLIAAKLEQNVRPDLTVVALSSPTSLDGVTLKPVKSSKLYALYSSHDEVISGQTDWAPYTEFNFNVDWMQDHNIDHQRHTVSLVLFDFLCTGDFTGALDRIDMNPSCMVLPDRCLITKDEERTW
jgi:hypothetical protein